MRVSFIKFIKFLPVALFWLLVWEIAAAVIGSTLILVTPRAAFARLFALAQTAAFWHSIAISMRRIMLGFFLALLAGTVVAAAGAASKIAHRLLRPAVNVLNAMPLASFVLLVLFMFDLAYLSVVVPFVMVFPIMFYNVYEGIESTDPALLEMARVFRVRPWKRVVYIYAKTVAPFLLSAVGLGIGTAWKSGISAELIGVVRGTIGGHLHVARSGLLTADLFAWTIAIVALSYAINKIFTLLFYRNKGAETR